MSCKLYMKYQGEIKPVGKFKNREAAERYWLFYVDRLKAIEGHYAIPIYVENKKGRG